MKNAIHGQFPPLIHLILLVMSWFLLLTTFTFLKKLKQSRGQFDKVDPYYALLIFLVLAVTDELVNQIICPFSPQIQWLLQHLEADQIAGIKSYPWQLRH